MKLLIVAFLLSPALAMAQNLPVQRCVNLGDALDSPSVEGEWTYVIETADMDLVADAGFDTVRLPVRFSTRWDGKRIDPAFQARVDSVIRDLLARNLRVILDLHHFEDLMTDPAAHAATFKAIWAALGTHYAGWPEGLIFELLNEPAHELSTDRVIPLYRDIIADLRRAHPRRWIIVEAGGWANRDEMTRLPAFGPFTAHSFHYYEPFEFTHQQLWWDAEPLPARGWDQASERAAIRGDFDKVSQHPGPVFLGEFGTYGAVDPASRTAWLKAVRSAAESHGIGWCVWSFASNFGIVTADKTAWRNGILPALGLAE